MLAILEIATQLSGKGHETATGQTQTDTNNAIQPREPLFAQVVLKHSSRTAMVQSTAGTTGRTAISTPFIGLADSSRKRLQM